MTKPTFADFALPEALRHTLEHMKYINPTPIQEQAIPVALKGKDILGTAQTGTGKTAAFGIPLVARMIAYPESAAIVLTPTRELAMQVMDIIAQMLGKQSKIKRALLIGGASMGLQLRDLKNNPRIIVGTPGRINDHLKRKTLNLSKTDFLVLDETDRMLDMGFSAQIDLIVSKISKDRQTLMFSATMPDNIVRLAQKDLRDPVRITVGSTTAPILKIKQDVIYTNNDEKYTHLMQQLESRKGSVIIFVKTKRNTEKLGQKLKKDGHSVDVIHGDLRQGQRKRVIDAFRDMHHRIMVATDVAARGLDIPHIEHVINFDMPQVPEDYIHRIGRTGRNGQEGSALCLVSPDDKRLWREIEKMMDPTIKHEKSDDAGGNRDRGYKGRKSGGGFKKKSYGDKPRENRGERSFGGGTFKDRKADKPRGEHRGERSFEDRGTRSFDAGGEVAADREGNAKTGYGKKNDQGGSRPERGGVKHYDDKGPRGPRARDDRPRSGGRPGGDRKPWQKREGSSHGGSTNGGERTERNFNEFGPAREADGNRVASENRNDGNSTAKKSWGDKPRGDKKFGDKKPWDKNRSGGKKFGDKKPWDKNKSSGDRKPADGTSGSQDSKRHEGGKKHWERKDGGNSGAPKKKFDRPFGTPKFDGQKKRDMNPEKNTGGR